MKCHFHFDINQNTLLNISSFCLPSNNVSITSVMHYFIISASENGLLCLPKIHTTLSEHPVAFCCCVIDVTRILGATY